MLIIGGIKKLLHEDGITIKGTQKIIKDNGLDYVSKLSKPLDTSDIIIEDNTQTNAEMVLAQEAKTIETSKEAPYSQKFNEVDGQFPMFSDENTISSSKESGPDATYKSISDYIKSNDLADQNRSNLEDLLKSINHAIKKRA